MRIPTFHNRDDIQQDQSMTPMIDVVFLLLIFFICASVGQIRESLLPAELAAGSLPSDEILEQPKPLLGEVWVHLRRTADEKTIVELNGREFDDFAGLEGTLRSLAELAPEIPVILDIEPAVPLGDVIRVYDTCRAAEFESIHFATEAPSADPGSGPVSRAVPPAGISRQPTNP